MTSAAFYHVDKKATDTDTISQVEDWPAPSGEDLQELPQPDISGTFSWVKCQVPPTMNHPWDVSTADTELEKVSTRYQKLRPDS
jgi:hypothetical protein